MDLVERYYALLKSYLAREIPPSEFVKQYFVLWREYVPATHQADFQSNIATELIESFFLDADAFAEQPDPKYVEIDAAELYARARTAFQVFDAWMKAR